MGRRTGPASLCEAERPRLCLPREAAGRRHRPQPRRRALAGHRTCGRSGLGLPASSADRNKHLLFKPPRPSCFVMENYPRRQCVHQEAAGTLAATRPEWKAGPVARPEPRLLVCGHDTTARPVLLAPSPPVRPAPPSALASRGKRRLSCMHLSSKWIPDLCPSPPPHCLRPGHVAMPSPGPCRDLRLVCPPHSGLFTNTCFVLVDNNNGENKNNGRGSF